MVLSLDFTIFDHTLSDQPPRITTPKIVNDKNGHELAVNCMAWSCDGHYLATGSDDRTVRIWQYKVSVCWLCTLWLSMIFLI